MLASWENRYFTELKNEPKQPCGNKENSTEATQCSAQISTAIFANEISYKEENVKWQDNEMHQGKWEPLERTQHYQTSAPPVGKGQWQSPITNTPPSYKILYLMWNIIGGSRRHMLGCTGNMSFGITKWWIWRFTAKRQFIHFPPTNPNWASTIY